jgi:hypothetical protein
MRIMFVYWAFEDQGSGLLINGYSRAAKAMGHEVVVYGRPIPNIPLSYSMDLESVDALVYIFEWTTSLLNGDNLDFARLSRIPRRRTVILDGDGNYNDLISVDGDYNHRDEASRDQWIAICNSLSDKICQPTLHPLRSNVTPFLFYCYSPAWQLPIDVHEKEFGVLYVGNSKFRWSAMSRVLRALAPIRDRIGRIGVVGHGWEAPPPWARSMNMEAAYFTDVDRLRRLGVEFLPPVPFSQVVCSMSRALLSPVLTRPTFEQMRFVTPRYFETPAAGTIPLFLVDPEHVRDIYGEPALELVLPEANPGDKIEDIFDHPGRYASIAEQTRRHLAAFHSHEVRLRRLVEIIES